MEPRQQPPATNRKTIKLSKEEEEYERAEAEHQKRREAIRSRGRHSTGGRYAETSSKLRAQSLSRRAEARRRSHGDRVGRVGVARNSGKLFPPPPSRPLDQRPPLSPRASASDLLLSIQPPNDNDKDAAEEKDCNADSLERKGVEGGAGVVGLPQHDDSSVSSLSDPGQRRRYRPPIRRGGAPPPPPQNPRREDQSGTMTGAKASVSSSSLSRRRKRRTDDGGRSVEGDLMSVGSNKKQRDAAMTAVGGNGAAGRVIRTGKTIPVRPPKSITTSMRRMTLDNSNNGIDISNGSGGFHKAANVAKGRNALLGPGKDPMPPPSEFKGPFHNVPMTYRSEALEELETNVREGMEAIGLIGVERQLTTSKASSAPATKVAVSAAGVLAAEKAQQQQQEGGQHAGGEGKVELRNIRDIMADYAAADQEGEQNAADNRSDSGYDNDDNVAGPVKTKTTPKPKEGPGAKLCRSIFQAFHALLGTLTQLSDELELASTFLSRNSALSLVSVEALHGVLSHTTDIDVLFTDMRPTLTALYNAEAGNDPNHLPFSFESDNTSDIQRYLLLTRLLTIVGMIDQTAKKVSVKQEWNARSETCYVTLLEMMRRTFYECKCLWDNVEPEPYKIGSQLRKAWTGSGHAEELVALYMGVADDPMMFGEVCCEVLISTDGWCPDANDLYLACGRGANAALVAAAGAREEDNGIDASEDEDLVPVPRAVCDVLDSVRSDPLPRPNAMGRIVRRLLPPDAVAADASNHLREAGGFAPKRSKSAFFAGTGRGTTGTIVAISSVAESTTEHDRKALGMGGIGKTTMAAMAASRRDVRSYFKDGVAWIHLGQNAEDTITQEAVSPSWSNLTYGFYVDCLREIGRQLNLEGPMVLPDLIHAPSERMADRRNKEQVLMEEARDVMSRSLNGLSVLIVLDDVAWKDDVGWFQFQAAPEGGESNDIQGNVAVLVTTQVRDLLPAADTVELDLLNEEEAIRLLVTEAGQRPDHPMGTSLEARTVVSECACHPLAVRSVGRWLGLKKATAGVIGSVEEMHEQMAKSIEDIARNNGSAICSGDMLYDIMGQSFSPALNLKPTLVIKFCFAAYVKVFCNEEDLVAAPMRPTPIVPLDAVDVLFTKILKMEEKDLFQKGSLFYSKRKEATMLIPEALYALGVLKVITAKAPSSAFDPASGAGASDKGRGREAPSSGGQDAADQSVDASGVSTEKFLQVQHPIQQEYGDYLSTRSGGLGRLALDSERRWNRAFVSGYIHMKGVGRWDDPNPDACRRYVLEMMVCHMLRSDMLKEVAGLLGDESFVRGRLNALGWEAGTRRHIKDTERYWDRAKGDSRCKGELGAGRVMDQSYAQVRAVIQGGIDAQRHNDRRDGSGNGHHATAIRAGRALYELGFSLAEKKLWEGAISHWESSRDIFSGTLGDAELVAAIVCNVGTVYQETNEFVRALEAFKECRRIRSVAHGEKHILYARATQKVGDTHLAMSNFMEALGCYDTALDIMTADPNNRAADIGKILHNIGSVHYSREEMGDALRCYEDALRSMQSELGEAHPDLADTYQKIGNCHSDRGDIPESISQFEEAINLKRLDKEGGFENESDILAIEGMVHNLRGEQADGLMCYERAYKILRRNVPYKLEKMASLLHLIGCVYLIEDKHRKSMKRFEESLQTRRRMLGFVHLDIASTLFNMAFLHQNRNKFDKAIRCLEEALRIRRLRLPDSDKLAQTHEKVGSIYVIVGQRKKAELALEEALRIRRHLHGPDHETVASVLHEMGDLMDSIGEYEEAVNCFSDALDIRRRKLGTGHALVASTLYSLGFTLHNCDENNRALVCFEESLEIRKARFGEDAREVGDTMNILGFLRAKMNKLDEALTCLGSALRIRKLHEDYIKASDTLKNIGNVHREKQLHDIALENYKECLDMRRKELGHDHEKVADALVALGNVKSDTDDVQGALQLYSEALKIRTVVYGSHGEKVAAVVQNMGMLEFRTGDLDGAKSNLEEYVRIRSTNGSRPDSDFVNALFIIGNIHKLKQNDTAAKKCWREAYDLFNEIGLAEENPKIAKVMSKLLKDDKKGGRRGAGAEGKFLPAGQSSNCKAEMISV